MTTFAIPFGPKFVPGLALQTDVMAFDDFTQLSVSTTSGAAAWLDDSASGLVQGAVLDGGVMSILSGAAVGNDGIAQMSGVSFVLQPDRTLYYETRVRLDDTTQTGFFAGLAERGLDFNNGSPVIDCVGFCYQSDANLDCVAATNGGSQTLQDTGYDITEAVTTLDRVWMILAFLWRNGKLYFYVDGNRVFTMNAIDHVDSIPVGELVTPIYSLERTAGTAPPNDTIDVDYVFCVNERDSHRLWDGVPGPL